ncbi:pyrroline-5-carboxylate reductase [Candidatus Poribacteria bacterium]|nr:pyrroline-5-carboxylate reductase [Candidatus Poribacteria bacterium]
MSDKNILFIGAGNMAEAIISGMISANVYKKEQIKVYDINKERLKYIENKYKVLAYNDLKTAVNKSNILILAVKHQTLTEVLIEISTYYYIEQLVISIAAGINTNLILKYLGNKCKIIRVMPNTPALVKSGMSVICKAGKSNDEDIKETKKIFGAIGEIEELKEAFFNAVTALSGSGPAYIFLMLEALMDAGIKVGLSKETALKLAVETAIGSSKMLKETSLHPAELKNRVTSPGGTTIAALHKLEKGAFRALIMDAVEEAAKRAGEIEKHIMEMDNK